MKNYNEDRRGKKNIYALTSYARNSQKKQYSIFKEIIFSFAYLLAIWLLVRANVMKIEITVFFNHWLAQS